MQDCFDFSGYDLIIDARSPHEYAADHIPGAVNLPVVDDDEYAEVGTLHRTDPHRAYQIGVAYSLRNVARYLPDHIDPLPKRAKILVYCFRGGKRSQLWHDPLRTIGFQVDRIAGGWKAYREWVTRVLAELPGQLRLRVLCGSTGCGKTRLLVALRSAGAQVLDLEELTRHRGSLIGAIPGVDQPTQKFFDSLLLQALQQIDLAKPVWVESESKRIGSVQLPDALFAAMHRARCYQVSAPMTERVRVWREDYAHFEADPEWLIERLRPLRALVGGKEFSDWEALAGARQMPELFQRLMESHYDPAYQRSILKHYPQIAQALAITPVRLDREILTELAQRLIRDDEQRDDTKEPAAPDQTANGRPIGKVSQSMR